MTDQVHTIANMILRLTATELVALRKLLDDTPPPATAGVREPRNPIPPNLHAAATADLDDAAPAP